MSAGNARAFGALMDSQDLRLIFASCNTAAERLAVVARVRENAITRLVAAAQRVPTVPVHIAALYALQGKPTPAWNLADNEHAVQFVLALPGHAPTADEQRAAALLRACVLAAEVGDVVPYGHMARGAVFAAGRKPGTVGTVRAWVRKYVKKNRAAKPAQAWEDFKIRPPKGCSVSATDIWTEGAGNTSRAWFGTIVGQEKKKLHP